MYGKYFSSTYTGSMIGAGLNVFAVWGYIIANTVKSRVELNPRLLAILLGGEEEEITNAIAFLEKPDPKSRYKEHDGRRIIREGEYQYFVPAFKIYRNLLNEDERREYLRVKQAEHRKRLKCQHIKECQGEKSTPSTHTEAEAEAEANTINSLSNYNNKKRDKINSSAERGGQAPSPPASLPKKEQKKKYTIQFDFETRSWLGITTDDLSSWEKAYPAVDIHHHLNRMKEWLLANPGRRKINYRRFITNWFSKQQDRPPSRPVQSRDEYLRAYTTKRAAELKAEEEAAEKEKTE